MERVQSLKPIITVYSGGTPEETKKFEGFITAAFWIGLGHTEGDVASVKVRQPSESYDIDVANLNEFTTLLVQRQINFSVDFFTEPSPHVSPSPAPVEVKYATDSLPHEEPVEGEVDFEGELMKIKNDYQKGVVTKKQYETKKNVLLKKWKEKIEGSLEE